MLNLLHHNPEFSEAGAVDKSSSGMATPISGTMTPVETDSPNTSCDDANTSSEDISMTTDVDDDDTKVIMLFFSCV